MGANRGQLRDLARTREEQTGTQLSEEARREQNSSSLPLSQSISPSLPPLLSSSPALPPSPLPKSEAQHDSLARHGDPRPSRERPRPEGCACKEGEEMGVEGATERNADE